jgi:hypothetical protein
MGELEKASVSARSPRALEEDAYCSGSGDSALGSPQDGLPIEHAG